MVLILTKSDLKKLLTMDDVIQVVEQAFLELAKGSATMPSRISINHLKENAWIGVMPAFIEKAGVLSIKIVTVYEKNQENNLPTVNATIILYNAKTGDRLAIMDGTFITSMRTGAASGIATKYLARKNSRIVGIFGAGVQAQTQLMAACTVRNISKALVYSLTQEKTEAFAAKMSKTLKIPVETSNSIDILKESDIIITATTAKTPVFNGQFLREGTHVNAIGSFKKDEREIDEQTIKSAKVVVDQKTAALEEAGDIIIPIGKGTISQQHIYAELGEIIAGFKQGRTSETEITLFKSVGLGIQDCATAWLAYSKAKEKVNHTEVNLNC